MVVRVDKFDVTPEVHYKDGRAVKVITYCVFNKRDRGQSEYAMNPDGTFTEWHYDPEHGGSLQAVPVPRSRLQELDEHNPHTIPLLGVLGQNREAVERLLSAKGLDVKHLVA